METSMPRQVFQNTQSKEGTHSNEHWWQNFCMECLMACFVCIPREIAPVYEGTDHIPYTWATEFLT